MTREQKVAEAKRLRSEGLIYREIGERLGVSLTVVYRWLNPISAEKRRISDRAYRERNRAKRRAYDRQYKRTHKAECPQCGGKMDRSTARRGGLCLPCHEDRVDSRARQIERWWGEGLKLKEIAAKLGWSEGHLSVEMHKLREKGYDLPYRRAVHNTPDRKPRYPEQVAA